MVERYTFFHLSLSTMVTTPGHTKISSSYCLYCRLECTFKSQTQDTILVHQILSELKIFEYFNKEFEYFDVLWILNKKNNSIRLLYKGEFQPIAFFLLRRTYQDTIIHTGVFNFFEK